MFFGFAIVIVMVSAFLMLMMNVYFVIGIIWGGYIVFSSESWRDGKWISYAKTIIPDFDQKIAQDKEFAKWVYTYMYGTKKTREYIKNLNPEAGKEIEKSM